MIFLPVSDEIAKRLSGPGSFRFIIQPIAAIALGIRDGLMDAKAGEPPYLMGLMLHRNCKRKLCTLTVQHILKPLIIGVIIDLILQYFIFDSVRLIPAVIVGLLAIGLPYALTRGITNRIATSWRHRRQTRS